MRFVIVPGINGSDDDHWQSIWQAAWGESATRISPSSWDEPDLDDWCGALDRAVTQPSTTVLVAHSLGCHAATAWVTRRRPGVRGLFLVAPPDTAGPNFPEEAATFTTLDPAPIETPGLMIVSENDLYCDLPAADRLAAAWQVARVGAGPVGHINSASGLGGWGFGQALLIAFTAGLS
jgi:uncharacterized protein